MSTHTPFHWGQCFCFHTGHKFDSLYSPRPEINNLSGIFSIIRVLVSLPFQCIQYHHSRRPPAPFHSNIPFNAHQIMPCYVMWPDVNTCPLARVQLHAQLAKINPKATSLGPQVQPSLVGLAVVQSWQRCLQRHWCVHLRDPVDERAMAQGGGQHVDPFMVADPSELSDWRLPLSFMKPRHGSDSSEGDQTQESWRMKERVRHY